MDNPEISPGSELKLLYKNLRRYYDWMPRDPGLENYLNQFSFEETIRKIYAVGTYCWFISDMKSGKFLKVGGSFEKMTGYKTEEIINKPFIKAARFTNNGHLADTLKAANYFWDYFYSKDPADRKYVKSMHTYRFSRKDGSNFHALQQSSTLFFDHSGNGLFQFDLITDISPLDPIPQLRFFILDSSDENDMKQIPVNPFIIKKTLPLPISPAEYKVLELIAQGKSIKVIASELRLSENTIKHHRTSMFEKCNVKNMAELIAKALGNGWFNH
jgi:DNA-binding CsgD family transcriptional regulator